MSSQGANETFSDETASGDFECQHFGSETERKQVENTS